MKHFPKPLISFRKLQGGQFGTLDVEATDPHQVQVALGSDFIRVTRAQWIALRCAVDRFFGCETETIILTSQEGGPVIFEEREEEVEEVRAAPLRSRAASSTRRRAG